MKPRKLLGVALLVAATAACGRSADAGTRAPATKPTVTPTTVHKENPYYDSGDTVTITATGFQPKELIAEVKLPIHFVNHTTTVQQVQFEHSRDPAGNIIHSAPIPPGGTWSYTPQTWESATYHSVGAHTLHGQIQIQPPAEP